MSPPLDNISTQTPPAQILFPCSLAMLVEHVRGKVGRDEFKSLKSAAKVLAGCLHKKLDTWVIDSIKHLFDEVHSIHPLRHGIKASYLRVSKSRLTKIVRLTGIELLSGHCRTPLPREWEKPVEAARLFDEKRLQYLMPFVRNRILAGRTPDQISQADFETYCVDVDETSTRKNKLGSKQGAQREWNYFASHVDVWPKFRFEMENGRDDYMLSDEAMPPAMVEFEAMVLVPFRGNGKYGKRRRRLSKETVKSRRYTFRRIISAAVAGGIDPSRLKTKADVCELDVLETAFNYILDRNDDDVEGTCDVCRLSGLMYAVAEQWVSVTGKDLENHKQLDQDYQHIQQGMSEKNQRLLAQLSSDKAIAAFLNTPKRVMDEYTDKKELSLRDLVRMQMAAAMSILTRTLIRMENLKRIEDRKHLIESGWGSERHVLLAFGKKEVKNDEYLETLLSPRVVAVVDTYKRRAWPKLKRGKTNSLFPGYGGKHKSASTFGPQLSNFVFQETGIRVTPHQFRHLGGYFHLLRYPGDYASVQKMLGHRKIETTIKFYTGTMDRRAAFQKYDDHIDARIDAADAAQVTTQTLRIKNYAQ
jgi:site-specific recombinase XerD